MLSIFLRKVGISEIDALTHFKLAPLSSRRDIAMLGVIHRAVLGEGPPQLREFFQLDKHQSRRSVRHIRHSQQVSCNFGSSPLDIFKRSVFGLSRVCNLLPSRIVRLQNVRAFQGALQQLLIEQAVADRPHWQALLSPRWPVQQHPLIHVL